MKNGIEAMITDITATTAEAEDYTGEDGLLYCGKCHTPKEAYFAEGKTCFGRDRHPAECDCQRAAREKQQAAESRQKHLEKVEDLKRRGFTDPAMRNWTFEHDNGRNPQTETARFYVESWETMQAENIGYLFWGGVGTGKSYVVKLDLPELRELVSLLRYSSNNLNQLTRRAHETGRIYEADLEDIQQNQERIWTAAEKIVSSLAALK